ncbi:hint module-domain-containing protein, partial [Dunaliella salina]
GDAAYFEGSALACQHLAYWEAEVVKKEVEPYGTCFPSSSIMWRRSQFPGSDVPMPVRMDSLRLGDEVMILNREGKVTWVPVLFMAHASKHTPAVFVELHTSSGRSMRASPDHLLMLSSTPKWDSAQALPARDASVGMYVFSTPVPGEGTHTGEKEGNTGNTPGSVVPVLITGVQQVEDIGLFAPITTSPDAILVVNGFAAHELTGMYSMRELSFWKWFLSCLHSFLGPVWFEAIHTWLHSHSFPEIVNRSAFTLRYYLHLLRMKG